MMAFISSLSRGRLGIYGDFLYGFNQTRYGTGPLEIASGPTIGAALDLMTATLNAAKAQAEGKESHLSAHVAQSVKGFVPGGNLWYTKAALDHLIFQNIQEQLSPGYLSNMRNNTRKNYGQSWWWEPGEITPERPPNLEAAIPE